MGEITTEEMIEIGEMGGTEEEAVEEVKTAEMKIGYRRTKKLRKISSTNSSCSFKPRTEVTLRYLNKLSKKNWIISSKNSWPNKKKRAPKLMSQLRLNLLKRKKRTNQLKSNRQNDHK